MDVDIAGDPSLMRRNTCVHTIFDGSRWKWIIETVKLDLCREEKQLPFGVTATPMQRGKDRSRTDRNPSGFTPKKNTFAP